MVASSIPERMLNRRGGPNLVWLTRFARRLFAHRLFTAGAAVVLFFILLGLFGPLFWPYDPNAVSVTARFRPPSPEHPLGTDNFGRDMLARVAHGARLSLAIGGAVALLTTLLGTALGLIVGYFKRIEASAVAFMDALMAFPTILLAIALSTALGPSLFNAVVALTVVYTPRMARIVRSAVVVVARMDYVEAARAAGANDRRILIKHILPNCVAPIIVQITFVFAYAVVSEAVLSFLGLGAPPPAISWGMIVAEGRQYLRNSWWICAFPGLAITFTVLGLNLLGDGLRDVLDPRIRLQPD